MQLFLQQIVEGLASGAIYASLALALVLIYRATRIVNFAQGEMATLSVYLAWQLTQWGVPFWLSLVLIVPVSFAMGALTFRLMIRPVLGASDHTMVVICIGFFVGFEAICLWFWGADPRAVPRLFPDGAWIIGGVRLTANNLGILATLCLLTAALSALFRFTRIGLAMRASAAEREKSPLVGIPVETMLMLGWGLAASVGFIAAALIAPSLFLSPPMMVSVVIYALAAATLGGWDSPAGAIVGGLVIGVAESLCATFVGFIGTDLKVGVPFALMAIILLVRPQGLFGTTAVIRGMSHSGTERTLRAIGLSVIAVVLLLVPRLFPDFLVYQFSLVLTYAIAILGLNLLMGFNGQISVAQGVFFAVGAYTTAIFMTRYGIHYLATLPIAVVTSSLLGLIVGIPALRWQGLPLAFITFGLAVLVPPLALKLEPITKGATGISIAKPAPPSWFPGNQDTFLYIVCLAGLALCVLIAWRLVRGDTGRALRATRDNGLIAESLGVNLTAVRLAAFTTSAGFAGFGGGLFAIVNAYVSPESFQMTKSFDFLVGSIIGGITSISGALIGALFIVFLPDWSADMNIALSGLIYGGVLVVMMLVARDGVVGLLVSLTDALRRRLTPQDRSKLQKVQT